MKIKKFCHVDLQVEEMLNQENWWTLNAYFDKTRALNFFYSSLKLKQLDYNVNSSLMVTAENRIELMVFVSHKNVLKPEKVQRIQWY